MSTHSVLFYNVSVCSCRFALKRHRNIHEKYGKMKPNVATSSSNDDQSNQQVANDETVTAVTSVSTTTDADHEEIIETKYEAVDTKYETVDASEIVGEEITQISELQVQLS